jgi:hypothetical protein
MGYVLVIATFVIMAWFGGKIDNGGVGEKFP